jgi:hypothetical protein
MDLQALHVAVLLAELVAHLQETAIECCIVHVAAQLQRLLQVLFEPQPDLIGRGLARFDQLLHFLNAGLCKLHQTFYFCFRIVLELQADAFTPGLEGI